MVKKKKKSTGGSLPKALKPFTGKIPVYPERQEDTVRPRQHYQRSKIGTTGAGTNTVINEQYPTKNIYLHHIHIRINDSLGIPTAAATIRDGVLGGQIFNSMSWQTIGDEHIIDVDLVAPLLLQRSVIVQLIEFGAGGNAYTVTIIGYLEDL